MTLRQFIKANRIKQADAVLVKKEKLGLFDHFVIFLGYSEKSKEPMFIANYKYGVAIIPTHELLDFIRKYKPFAIRRFKGSQQERKYAIQRAIEDLKTGSRKAYHLIRNNCEHFANWVQKGVRESDQVKDAGKLTSIGGIGIAAAGFATKNKTLLVSGLILTILGTITTALGDENTDYE